MIQLRSDLKAMQGYHSPQVSVEVRLNTNESPLGLPAPYFSELGLAISNLDLHRYPDRSALGLRTAIADMEQVSVEEIYVANGSNEVIENLLLAYGGAGRTAMVFEPSYALHAHLAKTTATRVIEIERLQDLSLDATLVESSLKEHQPDIVFLCSPNNPTGQALDAEIIEVALGASEGLVVVDEAYVQFSNWSALSLRSNSNSDRLVILRTFSKTWALAGVRLGFCIASPGIIEDLSVVTLPYHLSALTQLAGTIALGYLDDMESRVAGIVEERNRIEADLNKLPIDVWPSQANFVLFRPRDGKGHELWEHLVAASVLVRNCSSWPRLEGCLRVTVGSPSENDRFLEAVKEAL